jgi:hypothetical protein
VFCVSGIGTDDRASEIFDLAHLGNRRLFRCDDGAVTILPPLAIVNLRVGNALTPSRISRFFLCCIRTILNMANATADAQATPSSEQMTIVGTEDMLASTCKCQFGCLLSHLPLGDGLYRLLCTDRCRAHLVYSSRFVY